MRALASKSSCAPLADAKQRSRATTHAPRTADHQAFAPTRFARDFTAAPVSPAAPPFLQTKLAVGPPGDAYEREADRVAADVMSMPAELSGAAAATPRLQRACACGSCRGGTGKEEERGSCLQKKSDATSSALTGETVPPLVHEVLRAPGRPLDAATRDFMEPRFGHDFSQVRVHADARSAESARAVGALAYTVGRDVVFGSGQYQPHTGAGRQLLAHELSHTVQQGAAARRTPQADSPLAPAAPALDAPPTLQRALAFEFQSKNLMTTNKGKRFPRKFPNEKGHFHKGASGVELQTDTGSVLEFETKWFAKWSELRAQIQDAADIADGIAKAPKTFPFSQAKTLKAQGHLGRSENLEVILNDPTFKAAIQSTEGIALSQYGSLLKEHERDEYAKPTLSHAQNILATAIATMPKTTTASSPWVDSLHGFLEVLVNYILRAQDVASEIDRVSPVKARFRLMHRTNFASMFTSILNPTEQALFQHIVNRNLIPKELGLNPGDQLFVAGYWGHDKKSNQMALYQGGEIVAVASEDKQKIHDCSSKKKTPGLDARSCGRKEPKSEITIGGWLDSVAKGVRDELSRPYQGSISMGKRDVAQTGVEKGLAVFETRGYQSRNRSQPASKWVDFAEDVFAQAAACRPRKGTGTELVYDGAKPFDPKNCPK